MTEDKLNSKKWYTHGWGLVVAILFFPYFLIWYAWAESKWSKNVRIMVTVAVSVVMLPFIISVATAEPENIDSTPQAQVAEQRKDVEQAKEEAPKETFSDKVLALIKSGKAYDSGSYVKGDIPQGEYAFVSFEGSGKYYSEEDSAGNIVDNENFDSFGYVYVHNVGNITNSGVLIPIKSLELLNSKGAKDVYEKLNSVKDYTESGIYKVGTDINPGTYVIQSVGDAYAEVGSGPVGNSDIVDNNNFKGRYSVTVAEGQYLKISRAQIQK